MEPTKPVSGLSGRSEMDTQNLSEDVLLVNLPAEEPQIANELKHINELVTGKDVCNVAVDFSGVEMDPQMVSAISTAVASGQLSLETFWDVLNRGEIVKIDPDLEFERIESDFVPVPR